MEETDTTTQSFSDIRLLDELVVPYKELKGFNKKFHRIPENVSDQDFRYLAKLVEPEIDDDLQQTFGKLRSAYGFKRKQISVDGPADGAGTIQTPFFNYEILISQHFDNPSKAVWQRSVTHIENPENTFVPGFESVFGKRFSILEVALADDLEIEDIIDHVEDLDADDVKIDYDKDATWCEIVMTGSTAFVRIRENTIRVASKTEILPRDLLNTYLEVQSKFLATL